MSDALSATHKGILREALDQKDFQRADQIVEQLFEDLKDDPSAAAEGMLAYYTCTLYERHFPEIYKYLHAFVEKFPSSCHLVRLYRADFLLAAGSPDYASQDARVYLRHFRDAGMFSKLDQHRMMSHGVTKAFLLLIAVYSLLGARSYSRRVLKSALSLALHEGHQTLQHEYDRLRQELRSPENKDLDQKWELFFKTGQGAKELHELALEHHCEFLAKRIALIEANFQSIPQYKISSEEIFQLVIHKADTEGKSSTLLS